MGTETKRDLTRREFLGYAAKGAVAAAISSTLDTKALAQSLSAQSDENFKKPNILFITTDYQAWEDSPTVLPFLDMPAMGRLCKEGAELTRHYSSAPICMPARYSLITGQYPHSHKEFDNRGQWVPEGSPILMEHLKKAGYRTIGVGKMHFHPIDRMAGFDTRIIADQKEAKWLDDDYAKYLKANGRNVNRIYKTQSPDEVPRVYDFPDDENFHIDYFVGDRAKQVLEGDDLVGPWFMWVSFNGPHSPWDPPAKYAEPYKKMNLPKPRYMPNCINTKPANDTFERYIYSRNVMDMADEHPERRDEIFHAMRAAHYGNLTFIDRQVEKVFKALETRGEMDDTIIVWSADHGALLGDHDLIHKATHYERSAHTPFVVRYPKMIKPGKREALSGHVDFMPTVLSMAGIPVPAAVLGKNLTPVLTGKADSVQDCVFTEIRNDVSIVTKDWKLRVDLGPWQPTACPLRIGDLYDLKNDPNELTNLYDNPNYAKVQNELTEKIVAFHPAFASQIARPTPPQPEEASELVLTQGDVLNGSSAKEPLHQAGKSLRLSCEVAAKNGAALTGPILLHVNGPNGYQLAIEDGHLVLALRRWGKETLLKSDDPVPVKSFAIEAMIHKTGLMSLKVNGKPAGQTKAQGGIPLQPGQMIRMTAGVIEVGKAQGQEFNGAISNCLLRLIP